MDLFGQVAREAQAVATPKFAYRVRIERRFARRQQIDALQLIGRALGIGIKSPNAVDVPIKQIDA